MALLNLASLLLGIIGWICPLIFILKHKTMKQEIGVALMLISSVCVGLSLLFVITYNNYLVKIEDWSALMDTRTAFHLASTLLVVISGALNGFALNVIIRKNNPSE